MEGTHSATTSIIWSRVKTSMYALSTIVMAGWVTTALNEDLMFRLVTRYFFPEEVAAYQHPLSDVTSLLLWGVPLLVGLLLMLAAAVMTIHHIKKRHLYVVRKARRVPQVDGVILAAEADALPTALAAYHSASHVHIFCLSSAERPHVDALAAAERDKAGRPVTVHMLPETQDLHAIVESCTKVLRGILSKERHVVFDIRYAAPLFSSAAMYCSLETDLSLGQPDGEGVTAYDTDCVMES